MNGIIAVLVLLIPAMAQAHSPIKGIGYFYNGMLHPLVVPGHLLAMIAFVLWAGQRRLPTLLPLFSTLAVSLGAGLVLAPNAGSRLVENGLLATVAIVGLFVATSYSLPAGVYNFVAMWTGLAIGLDSGVAGMADRARIMTMVGTGVSVVLFSIVGIGLVELARPPAARIGIRIAGSWLAAASLLVLALGISGTI